MTVESCLFCRIALGKEKAWVVYRDSHVMAFLDRFPMTKGHTLVIPIRHYESMFDIPYQILMKIASLSKRLCKNYERTLRIQGVSIGVLNHKKNKSYHRHFHLHVIPRYNKNDERDPANVKPIQTFPEESDENLDRTLAKTIAK